MIDTWPSAAQVVLLILLAGWAAADTTAAFQLMVSQPLVTGFLAGAILGEPTAGLFMGAALQLLWSRLAPVGAQAFPDVGPATVCGVTTAWILAAGFPSAGSAGGGLEAAGAPAGDPLRLDADPTAMIGGLLAALLAGHVGQALTVLLRRDNARLATAADLAAGQGSFAGVERENIAGVLRSFSRGVVIFLLIAPALGILATFLVRSGFIPSAGNPGFVVFWWLGLASLLTTLWRGGRGDWGLLLGGAAFGFAVYRFVWVRG